MRQRLRRFPWKHWVAAFVLAALFLWGSLSSLWIVETIAGGVMISMLVALWALQREIDREQRRSR